MPTRDYPDKRLRPGEGIKADRLFISARINSSLVEYLRKTAYETRLSKQAIIEEALELHRKSREVSPTAE